MSVALDSDPKPQRRVSAIAVEAAPPGSSLDGAQDDLRVRWAAFEQRRDRRRSSRTKLAPAPAAGTLHARLVAFYTAFNPEKAAGDLGGIVEYYEGNEAELNGDLHDSYGADLRCARALTFAERVRAFYAVHNPEKLKGDLTPIVEYYQDNEAELNEDLAGEYGGADLGSMPSFICDVPTGTSAAGGATVEKAAAANTQQEMEAIASKAAAEAAEEQRRKAAEAAAEEARAAEEEQ